MKKVCACLLVLTLLLVAACSKDQKAIKEISGLWTLQYQIYGGAVDYQAAGCTWYFETCNQQTAGWCSSVVNCSQPMVYSMQYNYRIENDGKKLVRESAIGADLEDSIMVLDKHELQLYRYSAGYGVIIEVYAR